MTLATLDFPLADANCFRRESLLRTCDKRRRIERGRPAPHAVSPTGGALGWQTGVVGADRAV